MAHHVSVLAVDLPAVALEDLTARDPDLARVVERLGVPPSWTRPAGFSALAFIILEQQVSRASARAVFDRLTALVDPLTPAGFLNVDDVTLRALGFSRQKARYIRGLAQAVVDGSFDIDGLKDLDDADACAALLELKGVGPWTANVYLLTALGRMDVWPPGDVALESAAQGVKELAARPTSEELQAMAEAWRPWRSVAARILWHYYLDGRSRG